MRNRLRDRDGEGEGEKLFIPFTHFRVAHHDFNPPSPIMILITVILLP